MSAGSDNTTFDTRRLASDAVGPDHPLPEPDSEELLELLGPSLVERMLYGLLYRRRGGNPPTMREVRLFTEDALGEPQTQIDRRLRELRRNFDIQVVGANQESRYFLAGWSHTPPARSLHLSQRLRAQVLAPQRCAQCGRTPLADHVKLVVDHKVPQSWGGGNDLDNLQPLCEDCNAGKRDYFTSYNADADAIRASINWEEPQRRIGELLKAMHDRNDGWVRTDLLGIVASAREYQEDWQRRLRDLRFLGWTIESHKRYNEGARVWTYYRATQTAPWPRNIRAAITAEERRRAHAKPPPALPDE